ncbi:MAG: DUF4340 domain-containing protein [Candidatus Ornithomonoglobus sp.]
MKKTGMIAGAAAVVVLAAATVFVMNMDTSEKEEDKKPPQIQTVLVLDDAEEITVKAEGLDVRYLKADGSEVWVIDGVDASDISSVKMAEFIGTALTYETDLIIDDAGEPSEYGLDAPAVTVTIKAGDGEHTVLVGDRSAVDDVYFASADGMLFTMSSSQYNMLITDPSYYTEFNRISIDPDNITGIKIETADRTIDLYLPDISRLEGNVWMMREPYDNMANDSFLDSDVLEQIGALSLSKKAYSIGTEQARLTVTEGGNTYEFKLGDEDGGTIYIEYQGQAYSEPAELLAFIYADTFSFINKLVSYVNVQDISEMTAEYDGKTHTFGVSGSGNDLTYTADGRAADTDASKKLYSTVIGVVATGFYNNEKTTDTVLRLTFKGDEKETVVEYKKINEYTVAAVKDGKALFVTGAADAENVKTALDGFFTEN